MVNPIDETRDEGAQPIGEEEHTNEERPGEEPSERASSPAVEAEAGDGEPVEAAAPEADDDEYEMVDPAEFVEVPREEAIRDEDDDAVTTRPADVAPLEITVESSESDLAARPEPPTEPELKMVAPPPLRRHSLGPLPPPVKVAKALSTTSASIPPPPLVPSRTMRPPPPPKTQQTVDKTRVPPPPPLRRSSTSLPAPPRAPISSSPPLAMSGTVPPTPKPKNQFGSRQRSRSTKGAAVATVLALFAVVYFGAKRGEDTISAPSREVRAANPATEPQAESPSVAAEPAVDTAAVPTLEAPESKPSSSDKAEPAAAPEPIAAKTEAPKAEAPNTEAPKSAAPKTAPNPAACTLNFNTIPPSRVVIDGRDLGMTPKLGVSVQPGMHIVTFANAGGKKVTAAPCKAGEQKTVAMRLPI